ncbi:MAG: signal peptidase I [Bacillota bacterium]|nr:signal peptidase I [Bacillota bacterium]
MTDEIERFPEAPDGAPADPAPVDLAAAAEDAALIKKAERKMLSFAIAAAVVILIAILRQGQRLFIFNFTAANLNVTPASLFFSYLTYAFLLFTGGYAIFFYVVLRRRRGLDPATAAQSFPHFKKRYDLFDLLGVIPGFLAVVVIANAFLVSPAVVDGPSMEPTFFEGDAVVVYHGPGLAYAAGDIVIIERTDKLLIKRLIGLPGDHITVSSAGVYLNGTLIEPYVADFHVPLDLEIPEGYCFVLGDNRTQSNDSRYFGLIPESALLGKVVVKIDLF